MFNEFDNYRLKHPNFLYRKVKFVKYFPQKNCENSASSKLIIKGKNIVDRKRFKTPISSTDRPKMCENRYSPESFNLQSYLTIKKIDSFEIEFPLRKKEIVPKPQVSYIKPNVSLFPSLSVKSIPKRSLTPSQML